MSETIYIIKPEAFSRREEIRTRIQTTGKLKITGSIITALTESDLRYLASVDEGYLNNTNLFEAYSYFMRKDFIEMGVIEGQNAIEDYRFICDVQTKPELCSENSLRRSFGKEGVFKYKGAPFFLNGIHKSNTPSEALLERVLYEELKHRSLEENVKERVFRSYQFPPQEVNKAYSTNTLMVWEKHIQPTVTYAQKLARILGADQQVVTIASYYHDITRLYGDDENHHYSSGDIMEKDLKILGCESNLIREIKECILRHRGSKNLTPITLEEKVVASADAMSTIANLSLLWYASKFKHNFGNDFDARKKVIEKLEKAFNKIMPEARSLIEKIYKVEMTFLENEHV